MTAPLAPYYQLLCERGHYNVEWAHGFDPDDPCRDCGGAIAWRNLVTANNGAFVKLRMVKDLEMCTCPCGHKHIGRQATYALPVRISAVVKNRDEGSFTE